MGEGGRVREARSRYAYCTLIVEHKYVCCTLTRVAPVKGSGSSNVSLPKSSSTVFCFWFEACGFEMRVWSSGFEVWGSRVLFLCNERQRLPFSPPSRSMTQSVHICAILSIDFRRRSLMHRYLQKIKPCGWRSALPLAGERKTERVLR